MTNADWWLRVRQQRDAVQPRQATDVELWRLTRQIRQSRLALRVYLVELGLTPASGRRVRVARP